MARVPLLAPDDLPAEHRAFGEGLDVQGAYINIYRGMAHSPVALRRFLDLASSLWGGALTPRVREIAILTVVSASEAPYPLGWHILDAADAGLTMPEIQAIVAGDADAMLPPDEPAIARFAREFTIEARVSDAAFCSVADTMDERQIVELTMVCGLYRLVAAVANTLQVDLDEEPARALRSLRPNMNHQRPATSDPAN